MRDIEGIEDAIALLRPHQEDIDAQFDRINNQLLGMLNINHEPIGRVLRAHLVIENFMTEFLSNHFGLHNIFDARLSFHQKAILLPSRDSPAAVVRPGILQLNAVRNKFGHQLGHEIHDADISSIYEILRIARPGIDFDNPIDAIDAFTSVACAWLSVAPEALRELFRHAFANLRFARTES
jgi:hypothetical protein